MHEPGGIASRFFFFASNLDTRGARSLWWAFMSRGGFVSCLLIAASVSWTGRVLAQGTTGGAAPSPTVPSAPPPAPILTVFTTPKDGDISLYGSAKLGGKSPFDVPPSVSGRFNVIVEADGLSRTHGVVYLPPRGGLPFLLSEPREGSMALFLRGFNYPGVPNWSTARPYRGIALAAAGTGGLYMALNAHLSYRDRLDEVGDFAAERARQERAHRNGWLIYTGGVWAMSALDYWIRPRLELVESTPTRLTVDVPQTTRLGALWRSLIVPGAGQEFANHRTRSTVWLGTVLFSAAGFVYADYRVNREEHEVDVVQDVVDNASPADLPDALLRLEQEQRDLDASKDLRTGFAIAALGFYALNLADASIMWLSLPVPTRPKVASVEPIVSPEMTGAALHLRF